MIFTALMSKDLRPPLLCALSWLHSVPVTHASRAFYYATQAGAVVSEKGFSANFRSKTGLQRPKNQFFEKLHPIFFLNKQMVGVRNTWFKFGKDLMTISVFKLST